MCITIAVICQLLAASILLSEYSQYNEKKIANRIGIVVGKTM